MPVIVAAGTETDGVTRNPDVELYTPPPAGGSVGTLEVVGAPHPSSFYPRLWALPDGTVLDVTGRAVSSLNPASWTWILLPSLLDSRYNGAAGILLPGGPTGSYRVLMTGGETNKRATPARRPSTPPIPPKGGRSPVASPPTAFRQWRAGCTFG